MSDHMKTIIAAVIGIAVTLIVTYVWQIFGRGQDAATIDLIRIVVMEEMTTDDGLSVKVTLNGINSRTIVIETKLDGIVTAISALAED